MATVDLGNRTKAMIVGRGAIGATETCALGQLTDTVAGGVVAHRWQSFTVGSSRYVLGGEDLTVGNPAQPSIRMDASGKWRFRWALTIGSHMISVNVLHAINQNPRPSIVIKANPAIGIPSDIETFAPASTGWVTISSPSFPVTALGVTWVELHNNLETNVGAFPCFFDHIVKT